MGDRSLLISAGHQGGAVNGRELTVVSGLPERIVGTVGRGAGANGRIRRLRVFNRQMTTARADRFGHFHSWLSGMNFFRFRVCPHVQVHGLSPILKSAVI